MPSYQYRDGELVEVPDLVMSESGDVHDAVNNTLVIESGVSVTTHGVVNGTVSVRRGARLDAVNKVNGTVHVESGAEATFKHSMGGTLHVERGGTATLEASAVALGTMHIEGMLINHGTRGGSVHGAGQVDDREGSTVRPPDETLDDGTVIYRG